MTVPDLEPFRTAQRLEWHAWTVFDGDQPEGDGNMDGDLRAVTGGDVVASVPLDIFSPEAWTDNHDQPPRSWIISDRGPMGVLIANPRTSAEVKDEVRRWCSRELGRDDVVVNLQ